MKNHSYRNLLERSGKHSENEHTNGLKGLIWTFGIPLLTGVWLASFISLTVSLFSFIDNANLSRLDLLSWTVVLFSIITATMIFALSKIAVELPRTVMWIAVQIEDSIGRVLIYLQALGHSTFHGRLRFVRSIAGVLIASCAVWTTLMVIRSLVENVSVLAKKSVTTSTLVISPETFNIAFTAVCAFASIALIVRFTFSAKWSAVYSKPQCIEQLLSCPVIDKPRTVRILHASDLHITASEAVPLTEGGKKIHQRTLLSVLGAMSSDAKDCSIVLLTGDITDDGSQEAWVRFLDAVPESMRGKIVVLPGNHDLNLQDRLLVRRAERSDRLGRRMRQVRTLCAMVELMGDRAYLVDRDTKRCMTLRTYFARNQSSLESQVDQTRIVRKNISDIWESVFPIVVVDENERLGVIVFDSTKPASVGLTNAFGKIPEKHLESCVELMAAMSGRCDAFVLALHHHVALPHAKGHTNPMQDAGLVCENAGALVNLLAKRGDPTVIFHGHRHVEYVGHVDNSEVSVVASPSATIGRNGEGDGAWSIVDLVISDHACWLKGHPERRRLDTERASSAAPMHSACEHTV